MPNSKGACHREGQGPDHGPSLSAVGQELAGLLPAQGHIGETAPDRRDGRGVCTRNTHLRQGYRRCEAARDLCPPFWESLRTHGRDKMMDIIARNNLQVRMPRKKPRTTDSAHGLPTYPNLVKEIIPTRKNQVWVTDITYVPIWLNDNEYIFCYVSIITDAYTKEIISWYVGESLEAWCSVECLIKAFDTLAEEDKTGLIHHSDRGVQYVSAAYTSLLLDAGIKISMTESGDPKDNAIAERINNTLKNELFRDIKFHSIAEVRKAMHKAVEFYNNERPHMSLNNMTPHEAALCKGKIQKKWTSYREKYLENLEVSEGSTTFAAQTLEMIESVSKDNTQLSIGLRE